MREPCRVTPDTYAVLTDFPAATSARCPCTGTSFEGKEPVLVDTGMPVERSSSWPPCAPWSIPPRSAGVFLTHDEHDYSNLGQVMELAPQARPI